ncbi:MAG: biopolymer transporter ExbD [Acidobacteriota bacterium]
MNIKPATRSFLSLESVAMTDIVMNLFIFFFISFSLLYTFNPTKESRIEVQLPSGRAKSEGQGRGPLVVTVNAKNEIFIAGARVSPESLESDLKARSNEDKQVGVMVRADQAAAVEYLVKVLDAAKQAGVAKLGVAIEQSK